MDPSSCHCHYICWSRFGKSAEILCHWLVLNDALVQWLMLLTNIEWCPHPLQTYESYLTTFICCGRGYGSIIMPLPLHLSVKIWEISWNPGSLIGAEWRPCAVVDGPNPHGMVLKSTPNIWKLFDNLHMLWMGIWIHHHAIAITFVGQDLGNRLKSCVTDWCWMMPLCSGWCS